MKEIYDISLIKYLVEEFNNLQKVYDNSGVRTHALADWRLKPAP